MGKDITSQSKHPRHVLGPQHKNPGKFRNALAQVTSNSPSTPGDSSSLLNRLRQNDPPDTTKGKMIIAGIAGAFLLYFIFYRG